MLKDPKTGFLVITASKIREVSLDYCTELLTNRAPREGDVDFTEHKEKLHELRMKEYVPNDVEELSHEMFSAALRKVRKRNSEKYKFLVNAGQALLGAVFELFSTVWRTERVPKKWLDSELIQLYKGRGSKNNLENMRHLHIKDDLSKLFQQIIFMETKEQMINNMTKFQLASKPGHRATEHLFCVMSLIQLT